MPPGADAVVLTATAAGLATGQAYVQLADHAALAAALARHRSCMGKCYVEVYPSSRPKMLEAMQNRYVICCGACNVECMMLCVLVSGVADRCTLTNRVDLMKCKGTHSSCSTLHCKVCCQTAASSVVVHSMM